MDNATTAFSTEPEPVIPPPAALLSLTEAPRAIFELLSLKTSRSRLQKLAPRGDGHPVIFLPGFFGDDNYSAPFRRFLAHLDYGAHGWAQGRNYGPREGVIESMRERLQFIANKYDEPVSLVGHSLGGVIARELAREFPHLVRQVISIGSPFGRGRFNSSVPARIFTRLNPPDEIPIDQDLLHLPPPVPTTAIYSMGDGIVHWRTARHEALYPETQSIRVFGSHFGMTFNPLIWYLVAERLSVPKDNWQPFERKSWHSLFYPEAVP